MDITERIPAHEYIKKQAGGGDPEMSYKNRVSSDRGRIFEQLIIKGCEFYQKTGKALISKIPEPYLCRKIFKSGGFNGIHLGQAEPDFKGTLFGGKSIVFEAKATRKDRIQQKALTDKQFHLLEEQYAMGAKVFVCINIQTKYFMVPWYVWVEMRVNFGRRYLMAKDIPEYEIIFDGSVRFLDYKNGAVIK